MRLVCESVTSIITRLHRDNSSMRRAKLQLRVCGQKKRIIDEHVYKRRLVASRTNFKLMIFHLFVRA